MSGGRQAIAVGDNFMLHKISEHGQTNICSNNCARFVELLVGKRFMCGCRYRFLIKLHLPNSEGATCQLREASPWLKLVPPPYFDPKQHHQYWDDASNNNQR